MKTLLCNTDYFYIVDIDVQPNRHRMHVLYFEATLIMPVCYNGCYTYIAYLVNSTLMWLMAREGFNALVHLKIFKS